MVIPTKMNKKIKTLDFICKVNKEIISVKNDGNGGIEELHSKPIKNINSSFLLEKIKLSVRSRLLVNL